MSASHLTVERRVALVTGGASGIGRAVAARFVQDGLFVAVVDRNATLGTQVARELCERVSDSTRVCFFQCDVAKVSEVEATVQACVKHFGALHVLVNSAGVMLEKNAVDTTEEEYDRIMNVNVKGTFFFCKYAVTQLRKQGKGSYAIVNVASVNSYYGEGGIAAYCTSKGAIAQLTRALAMDHSAEGVRVNGVCPGWIETPMNANFFALGPHIRKQADKMHAIGRIGQPEEVAGVVSFLASADASFMTGALVPVDGGLTAGLAPTMGIVL